MGGQSWVTSITRTGRMINFKFKKNQENSAPFVERVKGTDATISPHSNAKALGSYMITVFSWSFFKLMATVVKNAHWQEKLTILDPSKSPKFQPKACVFWLEIQACAGYKRDDVSKRWPAISWVAGAQIPQSLTTTLRLVGLSLCWR